jgi:hypothetical protein
VLAMMDEENARRLDAAWTMATESQTEGLQNLNEE